MSVRGERLEAAIEWLCEAIDANVSSEVQPRRLTKLERRDAAASVRHLNQAIQPRRLPPDIEWFWTTWQAHSFDYLDPFASLIDPEFALASWERDLTWPRALLWVGYESHCFLGVELDYPDAASSQIFADSYASGEGLRLVAPDLATRVSACAAVIEQHPDVAITQMWATIGADEVDSICSDALLVNGVGPAERGPYDWYDMLSCPVRWQRQQGIDTGGLQLRGPTCTIAELNEAMLTGPVEATIVGHARTRAGTGAGRLLVVSDDTDEALVWLPTSVPNVGNPAGGAYEIDVVAKQVTEAETGIRDFDDDHAEASRRASSGDISGAAEIGARMGWFVSGDHAIVARAMRPID